MTFTRKDIEKIALEKLQGKKPGVLERIMEAARLRRAGASKQPRIKREI